MNGYCGVYDESHIENPLRNDRVVEPKHLKNPSVSDYKLEPKDYTKYDKLTDTVPISDKFDGFHEEIDPKQPDIDNYSKLSLEDKLDLEEYNEQMIPNPNFYKINNEMHVSDEQVSKEHDTLRNELGFSPVLSQYPTSGNDVYSPIANDYGNENQNNVQREDVKRKRNIRDFDASLKTNFNHLSYGHLNDQDDTSKNDLSHEADYKLSKNELDQESPSKQRPQKNNYQNQYVNGYKPQNKVSNNLHKNPHASEAVSHYNSFHDFNKNTDALSDSNKNSHGMKTNSKTNIFPKKQSFDSKSQQQQSSKHYKSDQLANEINLKISNRMMSRGLGASLPSQSVDYYPSMYRHPMNIDVENQNWKDGGTENSNDFNDYIGRQRRLLQFDYEEPMNDYQLHENHNAPNEQNLLKIGVIKTLNNQKKSKNKEVSKTVHTNSKERRNLKTSETIPDNLTIEKQDPIKISSPKSQAKTNQSESNNTLHSPVDSLQPQLKLNVSDATAKANNKANEQKNHKPCTDHGKIVKRSAAYDKQFGLQE